MSPRLVQRSLTTRHGLCLALALSLAGGPVAAAPTADAPPSPSDPAAGAPDADEEPATPPEPSPETDVSSESEPSNPTASSSPDLIVESEEPESYSGIGGSVVSSTDPEAKRARADLEGTALLENASDDVPERLPPLQRAAWWTMFGTFALATTGGVFAGMAEVQEDRALRLSSIIDLETGGRYSYDDKKAEYDEILDKGARQAGIARGFLIGAGVTLVAGIALFAVDAKRSKKKTTRARVRPTGGGLEVRF